MDTQQHEQEQKQPPDEQILQALIDGEDGNAGGIPIVRTSTPRPLSFARSSPASEQGSASANIPSAADFPVEAPAAPPLPEESEEGEHGMPAAIKPVPPATVAAQAGATIPEFTWLFEYGLEMDEGHLNSPSHLNGQAYAYGPAVLSGYRIEGIQLKGGQTAITLAKASPQHEVWGVLYRIPRKLAEPRGSESSVLDKAHISHLFKAVPVVAQEMYRKRMVQCITYILSETDHEDFVSSSTTGAHFEQTYARRLLEVARQQHLPEAYLQTLAMLIGQNEPAPSAPIAIEQNTEPLPVVDSGRPLSRIPVLAHGGQAISSPRGWLMALSLYLVGILMAVLALAVVQALGYWNQIFIPSFTPLGAPWYVLLYGLLGGCISCIMALGRFSRLIVPGFVVLTWFTRPFLGMVLASLAYLVLSSGMFAVSVVPAQRYAICSVVAAAAGLCEGWLFFRRK